MCQSYDVASFYKLTRCNLLQNDLNTIETLFKGFNARSYSDNTYQYILDNIKMMKKKGKINKLSRYRYIKFKTMLFFKLIRKISKML